MGIWIATILPLKLITILPAITLIVVGMLVEKYYVGRIAILSNAVALATYFYRFSNLNQWLVLYINVLTIAGILALVSYALKFHLPREFYWFGSIFSSLVSGALLLYGLTL